MLDCENGRAKIAEGTMLICFAAFEISMYVGG
jgi:hypothetical protein